MNRRDFGCLLLRTVGHTRTDVQCRRLGRPTDTCQRQRRSQTTIRIRQHMRIRNLTLTGNQFCLSPGKPEILHDVLDSEKTSEKQYVMTSSGASILRGTLNNLSNRINQIQIQRQWTSYCRRQIALSCRTTETCSKAGAITTIGGPDDYLNLPDCTRRGTKSIPKNVPLMRPDCAEFCVPSRSAVQQPDFDV